MNDLKYTRNPDDLQRFIGKTISAISPVIEDEDGGYYDGDVKSVLITVADGDRLNISGSEEYHIAFEISEIK
jgi:hypothetical protein